MQETKWRLIDAGPADGPSNMAIDETIVIACARGAVPPTLRLYSWDTPCLSIGYFQSASQDVDLEECARLGIGVVRRLTGGRAVLHDRELTYSVVLPASHPLAAGGIASSYRNLSRGLAAGLMALGVPVETAPPGANRRDRLHGPNSESSTSSACSACFNAASDFELSVGGRKLVGSAQTRKRRAVLQHGSILLDFDAATTTTLLRADAAGRDRLTHQLRSRVISLNEALGREVSYGEVAQAIVIGFEQALDIAFEGGTLTRLEMKLASELAETKYRNPHWNLRARPGPKP